MTRASRMSEPLTRSGAAPAVDSVAPPSAAEPDDALAALLAADSGANSLLTAEQRGWLIELEAVKRDKSDYEKRVKALRARAKEIEPQLLALVDDPDLDLDYAHPFDPLDDGNGWEVRPFVKRPVYPKYRTDPETDESYSMEALIEAMRETDAAAHVIVRVDHQPWSSYVKTRVAAWDTMLGESHGRRIDGQLVDYDGEPLTAEEQGDPTADALALPRPIREIVDVVRAAEIGFTRRPLKSKAVAAVDAAVEAATAAAQAEQDAPAQS